MVPLIPLALIFVSLELVATQLQACNLAAKRSFILYNCFCHERSYLHHHHSHVNAAPHIGFGQEIVAADVIALSTVARQPRILIPALMSTPKDLYEGGSRQKPQDYTDEYAAKFASLKELLNLSFTHFIRTTDKHHVAAAQEFWRRCQENGTFIKECTKSLTVGCELKTSLRAENAVVSCTRT